MSRAVWGVMADKIAVLFVMAVSYSLVGAVFCSVVMDPRASG